jgi:hypothetical protein
VAEAVDVAVVVVPSTNVATAVVRVVVAVFATTAENGAKAIPSIMVLISVDPNTSVLPVDVLMVARYVGPLPSKPQFNIVYRVPAELKANASGAGSGKKGQKLGGRGPEGNNTVCVP